MKGKRHLKVINFGGITEFMIQRYWGGIEVLAYNIRKMYESRRRSHPIISISTDGLSLAISSYSIGDLGIDHKYDNYTNLLLIDGIDSWDM